MKDLLELSEALSELEPIEFENLIFDIVQRKYLDATIERNFRGQEVGFDIRVVEGEEELLIEIKNRSLIGKDLIHKLGFLWQNYKSKKHTKLILVISGTLTNDANEEAKKYNIEIWDIYSLHTLIPKDLEIKHLDRNIIRAKIEAKEDIYKKTLRELKAGGKDWQKEWSKYQKLISDILEHLFCPPLEPPRYEHTDYENKNRRDIIFENSSDSGFWAQIRNIYVGHYIVVDAKNYKGPIKKRSIIELAHYLKPYGCGLFGLVVSRNEESESSLHARKEQWIGNNKMIIFLHDEDLIEMLDIKKKGGKPEELIRMKIADFRMRL